MKFVLYGLIGLTSFLVALTGALAATGNLNKESFAKIRSGGQGEMAVAEEDPYAEEDELSSLARALKEREATLEKKAAALAEKEKALMTREAELRQLLSTIETRQEEIETLLGDSDKERLARRQTIAKTLEEMDPEKAGQRITGLDPEEAAAILRLMDEKDRAKIMEEMSTDDAIRLFRLLGEPPL